MRYLQALGGIGLIAGMALSSIGALLAVYAVVSQDWVWLSTLAIGGLILLSSFAWLQMADLIRVVVDNVRNDDIDPATLSSMMDEESDALRTLLNKGMWDTDDDPR